jgi:hypothetical protein
VTRIGDAAVWGGRAAGEDAVWGARQAREHALREEVRVGTSTNSPDGARHVDEMRTAEPPSSARHPLRHDATLAHALNMAASMPPPPLGIP